MIFIIIKDFIFEQSEVARNASFVIPVFPGETAGPGESPQQTCPFLPEESSLCDTAFAKATAAPSMASAKVSFHGFLKDIVENAGILGGLCVLMYIGTYHL